ncbi:hypothetical protein IIE18_10900 [Pseudomonas sp. V1]|uniref:hypothetical protein n=1 Tax=Pseudomonas arcuscaelestis TaxID=2710591 RepID=UPI0019402065|nr:hypothetical protein [Pseudomonas arcuscaelestis]MBM3105647.1 hypothetical protein [Pseudomonas arcuscaelestis]
MKIAKPFRASLLLAAVIVSGCAASWIQSPSPTTRNLVEDLKLEGYICKATYSAIECRQEKPYVKKAPKVCTSEKGCVEQPSELVTNVFSIVEDSFGIPKMKQWVETEPMKQ